MEFATSLAPAGALADGARAWWSTSIKRTGPLHPVGGRFSAHCQAASRSGQAATASIALPARLEPPSKEAELEDTIERRGWRRWGGRAALAVGGLLVGGVLVGTLTASAADTNGTANQNSASGAANQNRAYGGPGGQRPGGNVDESKSQRPDEQLLTGDTASKVRAAALAKYPGATVLRVETDSDGIYEAHLTTTNGQRVTVEVDKAFKVTGEESAPSRP
jgi:hypothetical protein